MFLYSSVNSGSTAGDLIFKAISNFDKSYFCHDVDAMNTKCNFKVVKRKLIYFKNPHNPILALFGKLMDFLANLNQAFCERFWAYSVGGFNEIYLELVKI